MTMVPMIKKCPKCHKKYSWNPDVGKMNCPYCHGFGTPMSNLVEKYLTKRKSPLRNKLKIDTSKKSLLSQKYCGKRFLFLSMTCSVIFRL